MQPRYPDIHVRIRSRNLLTLVAAVREELRRARVDRAEIRRFSNQALAAGGVQRARRICRRWVDARVVGD